MRKAITLSLQSESSFVQTCTPCFCGCVKASQWLGCTFSAAQHDNGSVLLFSRQDCKHVCWLWWYCIVLCFYTGKHWCNWQHSTIGRKSWNGIFIVPRAMLRRSSWKDGDNILVIYHVKSMSFILLGKVGWIMSSIIIWLLQYCCLLLCLWLWNRALMSHLSFLRDPEKLLLAVWGSGRLCHHEGQNYKSVERLRLCQIQRPQLCTDSTRDKAA